MTADLGIALREPRPARGPLDEAGTERQDQARLRVTVLRSAREIEAQSADWEDLAAHAVEPNPFYEPWMLLPALEAAGADPDKAPELVLVHAEGRTGRSRLVGLFPLERRPRYRGLPLGELRLWRHELCFLCTPLLRSGFEREALEAFLGWLARDSGASLLRLHYVPGEGLFHRALLRHFERHPQLMHFTERYTRALFRPRRSAEGYLRAAVRGRRLKEFRRLARRLADQGRLEYRQLGRSEHAADWIGAFLALEARGWKGRAGTALASTNANRAWFERIALEAGRRGRLLIHGLYLNGRALALSCKIRAGDGAYAFKIAYDEDYEQYSPGLLLELEQIVRMHGSPRIGWLDSCAVPEHFMANRLWLDRRALETVTVAAGGAGALLVMLLPLLRWARRRLARAP
ncbi:MAG TPA: GNAT family N-acetyltransferase [Burkholderiales bacterium]|nr:GNAT family N-acetyltransferase [Burkholderiales bacterium]